MTEKLYGYKCFYKGQVKDLYAHNKLAAQTQAARLFNARKHYDVSVVLCETPDGETVTHCGSEL